LAQVRAKTDILIVNFLKVYDDITCFSCFSFFFFFCAGADEQLGGYSRHRTAFNLGSRDRALLFPTGTPSTITSTATGAGAGAEDGDGGGDDDGDSGGSGSGSGLPTGLGAGGGAHLTLHDPVGAARAAEALALLYPPGLDGTRTAHRPTHRH
jgi:hypothetical protein